MVDLCSGSACKGDAHLGRSPRSGLADTFRLRPHRLQASIYLHATNKSILPSYGLPLSCSDTSDAQTSGYGFLVANIVVANHQLHSEDVDSGVLLQATKSSSTPSWCCRLQVLHVLAGSCCRRRSTTALRLTSSEMQILTSSTNNNELQLNSNCAPTTSNTNCTQS